MRILSVAWECPYGGYGGLSTFIRNLNPYFAEKGDLVHLCVYGDAPPHPVRIENYTVFRCGELRVSKELTVRFLTAFEIAKHLHMVYDSDLVVGHDVHAAPMVLSAYEAGRRSILYLHALFYTGLEFDAIRYADKVFVGSKLMSQMVSQFSNRQPEVVYPAPPNLGKASLPGNIEIFSRLVGSSREKYVLIFTRNQPNKWSEEIIRNILNVVKKRKMHLIVAGMGFTPETIKIKDDHLKVFGNVMEDYKIALMMNAKIGVYPSLFEPFGLVPLEFISLHTPVIVSKRAGVSEVLPPEASEEPEKIHELLDSILGDKKASEELLNKERESWIMRRSWRDVAEEIMR